MTAWLTDHTRVVARIGGPRWVSGLDQGEGRGCQSKNRSVAPSGSSTRSLLSSPFGRILYSPPDALNKIHLTRRRLSQRSSTVSRSTARFHLMTEGLSFLGTWAARPFLRRRVCGSAGNRRRVIQAGSSPNDQLAAGPDHNRKFAGL